MNQNIDAVRVPVDPESVRVWRGFRLAHVTEAKFKEQLGAVFIPGTVQLQGPLGLTAYLPSVLPDIKPAALPDEIALVFYKSKEAYRRTFETTAGRAYGLLHRSVFDKKSQSGFPVYLANELLTEQPYYLIKRKTDWYHGVSRVYLGLRKKSQGIDSLQLELFKKLKLIQNDLPAGLDGVIVCLSENHVICWEHWDAEQPQCESVFESLQSVTVRHYLKTAMFTRVAAKVSDIYDGIKINGGEFFNVGFHRLGLIPQSSSLSL